MVVRLLIILVLGFVIYQLVRHLVRSRTQQAALPPTDKGPLLQCAGCGAWFPAGDGAGVQKVNGQVYCRVECVGKTPQG